VTGMTDALPFIRAKITNFLAPRPIFVLAIVYLDDHAVSDRVVERHLRVDIVAGIYPLMPGNMLLRRGPLHPELHRT
jgi:hypothetical protein